MSEARIENVVIYRAERTLNSRNGNPGYKFHTSAGVYEMVSDASLGYGVANLEWSEWLARPDRKGAENRIIGNPDEPKVTLLVTHGAVPRVAYIEHNGKILN